MGISQWWRHRKDEGETTADAANGRHERKLSVTVSVDCRPLGDFRRTSIANSIMPHIDRALAVSSISWTHATRTGLRKKVAQSKRSDLRSVQEQRRLRNMFARYVAAFVPPNGKRERFTRFETAFGVRGSLPNSTARRDAAAALVEKAIATWCGGYASDEARREFGEHLS